MFGPEFIIHTLDPGIKSYLIFSIKDKKVTKWSQSVMSNSLWPHGLRPTRLHCLWDFLGKSTGVGCYFLLQGIFLTQGSNLGLPHCRQMLYWATREVNPPHKYISKQYFLHSLTVTTMIHPLNPPILACSHAMIFSLASYFLIFLPANPFSMLQPEWSLQTANLIIILLLKPSRVFPIVFRIQFSLHKRSTKILHEVPYQDHQPLSSSPYILALMIVFQCLTGSLYSLSSKPSHRKSPLPIILFFSCSLVTKNKQLNKKMGWRPK